MAEQTTSEVPRYITGPEGLRSEEMILNMGPQHPSTHGVLRLVLTLDGETVVNCTPVIGYLHRGIEKILENRSYMAGIRYMDNADYLSPMLNETAFVGAVEQLMGLEPPRRAQYIRLLTNELQRIASHLVAIGTYGLDLGAFTPVLYAFRDREGIMDMFEALGGSRFNVNYLRVGGVLHDFPKGWLDQCHKWLDQFEHRSLPELEALITGNEIFDARTQGVGYIDPRQAIAHGITGPILRASGVDYDVRRAEPYSIYDRFEWDVPVRYNGDCFDRYMIRVLEMRQSTRILQQALDSIPDGDIRAKMPKVLKPPKGEAYARIEGPKGEIGFYLISDGSPNPYRYNVRPPSFVNLTCLSQISVGHKLADAVVILGSFDIVMGEVDR